MLNANNSELSRLGPLLALAVALLCCHEGSAESRVFTAKVAEVHDGDTLTVVEPGGRQQRIRLAGVDAPEWRQAFDDASRRHLSNLVGRRDVEIRVTKRDQYSRLVAKVVVDGRDVCLEQLRAGQAWYYAAYESELSAADRTAYSAASREARLARRGLWADPAPVAPWRFRREARAGAATPKTRQPAPVEGKIIGNVRSGIYHLPQCPDWGKVSPGNRRYFDSEAAAVAAGFRKAGNCR